MGKKYLLVTIFLAVLVIAGGVYIAVTGRTKENKTLGSVAPSDTISSVEELKIEDIILGTGAEATAGKKVTVNYTGTLTDGTKFDSSYDRGIPFDFVLGAGNVIKGWDVGVAGMKVGGKRKLIIPPALGYGGRDMGSIPPNSTLIFEVELLKVQ